MRAYAQFVTMGREDGAATVQGEWKEGQIRAACNITWTQMVVQVLEYGEESGSRWCKEGRVVV